MDFYRRMHIVCCSVPKGRVATYGQIALLCGRPKNSRQAGYGLRSGLAGRVPAHRIVNAKGELSGAGYFPVFDLQKRMLEQEGVVVIWDGRGWKVDLKKYGWKNTLEDAERLRSRFEKEGC